MLRTVERMLKTNPEAMFAPVEIVSESIHACLECAQTCTSCADACSGEQAAHQLDHCIRLTLDTADIAAATARVVTRQKAPDLGLIAMALELCAACCQATALECGRHAPVYAHCQVCAAACHRCADACRAMIAATAEASRMHH
jgi:hypothetical protein